MLIFFGDIAILGFFIVIASVSKIYHRFFKSTLGIDLVFFVTVITGYRFGIIPALIVGYVSLIFADILGSRINYTSLISLIGLTLIAIASSFLTGIPLSYAGIIMAIIFEIVVVPLYFLMGSSPGKVGVFVVSHFLFNLFMFMNFG